MEWLNRLRAKSIRKSLVPFILMVAIAVGLVAFSGAWRVVDMISPKTLADLTPETAEGAYISDDIYFFYGDFIEVETYKNGRPTGAITSRYYMVDFDGEKYFIGLQVHQWSLKKSEAMMKACDDYMNYLINPDEVPVFHVQGTIKAMDSEELHYYHRAVGYDEALTEVMLPYYIDMNYVGDLSLVWTVILLAISLGVTVLGCWFLLKACTGSNQKQVRQMLKQEYGSLEAGVEKAAAFYDSTEPVQGVRLGREFVYFEQGQDSILLRPWDIAWAYQKTTQRTTNGIPSGKTFAAVLRLMNGKSYEITGKEKKVEELLGAMAASLPGTVFGYSQELEMMYKNQRNAFAARWAERRPSSNEEMM